MTDLERIEQQLQAIRLTPSKTTDDRVLTDASRALAQPRLVGQPERAFPSARWWRGLVAAAAVALVVVGVTFLGRSAPMTLADVQKALDAKEWVHIEMKSPNESRDEEVLQAELWVGFRPFRMATRTTEGQVSFEDSGSQRMYSYDPRTQVLTVSHRPGRPRDEVASPFQFIMMLIQDEEKHGATPTRRTEIRQGRHVEVFELTYEDASSNRGAFVCDRRTQLPIEFEEWSPAGARTMHAVFHYPKSGPTSVYDLGVPRTASVVGNAPADDVLRVLHEYEQHREDFCFTYQAIIASAHVDAEGHPSGALSSLHHVRRQGALIRSDQHSAWAIRPQKGPWPWSDIDDDFLKGLLRHLTPQSIKDTRLCLENATYTYYRQTNKVEKGSAWERGGESVERYGWPMPMVSDSKQMRLSEPSESTGNRLWLETTEEGRAYRDGEGAALKVFAPNRGRVCLNLERDYIAERRESEVVPRSEWPADPDWLEGVPEDKIPSEAWSVVQVTEYARAGDGKWYPKIVVNRKGFRTDTGERVQDHGWIYHIYVEAPVSFPEGTFDAASLEELAQSASGTTSRR